MRKQFTREGLGFRSQIALVVCAMLSMVGLVVIAAPSAQAAGLPVTGTHTVVATCDGTDYHAQAKYTYTITSLGTVPNSNPTVYNYRFQMNSAIYNGNSVAQGQTGLSQNRSPGIYLDNLGPIGAGVNGSGKPFPRYVTTATGSMYNGTNVTYAYYDFSRVPAWNTSLGWNYNVLRTDFYYSWPGTAPDYCVQLWDMSNPDAPLTGTQEISLGCGDGTDSVDMNLDYTLAKDGEAYTLTVTNAAIHQAPISETSFYDDFFLKVEANGINYNMTPSGGMGITAPAPPENGPWVFPTVGSGAFQSAVFSYIKGVKPAPRITWTALHTDSEHAPCIQSWYLGDVFDTPTLAYTNTVTYAFDDCSSSTATSSVTIDSKWQGDNNGAALMLQEIKVTNNSAARLRLAATTGGIPSVAAPRLRQEASGGIEYTRSNLAFDNAGRIWAPNEQRTLNISDPSNWTAATSIVTTSAPSGITLDESWLPIMDMPFQAFTPNGTGWDNCAAAASSNIGSAIADSFHIS